MSNTSDKLVASLLSAATTVKIHTREDLVGKTLGKGGPTPVDLVHLHSILLKRGPVTDTRCSDKEGIVIKTLTGRTVSIDCSLTVTVEHLKTLISNIEGIPVDQQRLVFTGKQLEDHRQLSDYNITDGSTLHMILRLRGGGEVIYVDYKFRAPKFDYDFRNIDDSGVEFRRGGLVYKRPIGTIRIALDVMNRYGDNNWLGVKGRATKFTDVPGEWAVSYHGTGKNNARSIAEDGFLLCKGQRFRFGHGIYSTPDFAVALRYAETFTHENEQYKFVVQNRVNPQTVKRVPASVTGVGEYWITEKEIDIRPYGFCFMKC